MPPTTTLDSLPNDLILLIADKCADACSEEDPAVLARLALASRSIRALLLAPSSEDRWFRAFAGAARGGDRSPPPHANLLPIESWWRSGQSNQASYGALVQRLSDAQRAPAPAPPPLSSPAGASVAAAWAAVAIERVIEAQAAVVALHRLERAVESQEDADEPALGEDGQPVTRARFHAISEEAIAEMVKNLKESETHEVLACLHGPISRREVRLHEPDNARTRAVTAAVETSVVAATVAERARAGGADASSLPPVAHGTYVSVFSLGRDVALKFFHAICSVGQHLSKSSAAPAGERGEPLGPPPSLAGPQVEEEAKPPAEGEGDV
jgi:hypothetical protein